MGWTGLWKCSWHSFESNGNDEQSRDFFSSNWPNLKQVVLRGTSQASQVKNSSRAQWVLLSEDLFPQRHRNKKFQVCGDFLQPLFQKPPPINSALF